MVEAARPRNVFADPFADESGERRPVLVILDDGVDDPVVRDQRIRLEEASLAHDVRIEHVASEAVGEVSRYASLLLNGTYAAEYLRLGLVDD